MIRAVENEIVAGEDVDGIRGSEMCTMRRYSDAWVQPAYN